MPLSDPVPPLHSFLYLSRAVVPFDDAALKALLLSARAFNEAHAVTGLLIYDYVPGVGSGHFCQYVEGPADAMREVRSRIEADLRHDSIEYLHEAETQARLFTSFAMGYTPAHALPDVEGFRLLTGVTVPRDGVQKRPAALLRVFVDMAQEHAHIGR